MKPTIQGQLATFCSVVMAWALLIQTAQPLQAAKPSAKEKILMAKEGSAMEIKLRDGRKLVGRLGATGEDSFEFQSLQNNRLTSQTLAFTDVKSAKPANMQAIQGPSDQKPSLKAQFAMLPAGSTVQVKLKSKQKLRGRLGAINDSGFEMQYALGDRVLTQTFRYEEVNSMALVERDKGRSLATNIVIGTLAGVGVLTLILVIACASGACSD